jgi:hypothetical protein
MATELTIRCSAALQLPWGTSGFWEEMAVAGGNTASGPLKSNTFDWVSEWIAGGSSTGDLARTNQNDLFSVKKEKSETEVRLKPCGNYLMIFKESSRNSMSCANQTCCSESGGEKVGFRSYWNNSPRPRSQPQYLAPLGSC